VFFAILATIGMGASNFLFGFAARETAPLMINWATCVFMALATLIYLFTTSGLHKIVRHVRDHKMLVLGVGFADNLAWVAYASSTLYVPIGLATALSEVYIVLAAGLGVLFNRERLRAHQMSGFIIAIIGAVVLASTVT
jgi:drug/metabolite transporter (DMT)-like permease